MINYILHLDVHLAHLVAYWGAWSYVFLSFAIFAETGLVITPFLPGDSLLFAAGIISARHLLNVNGLALLLITSGILGNSLNYWIGSKIGHHLFKDDKSLFLKKRYLEKTHLFYKKYGGKTLVLARFIPIVRTYAPFIAGVSKMNFKAFTLYNAVGAAAWVVLILYISYFFGSIPWIKNNFSVVIVLIIIASIAVPLVEWIRTRLKKEH